MRGHERPVLTTTDTKSGGLKEAEREREGERHTETETETETGTRERESERGRGRVDRVGLKEKTCGKETETEIET